MKLKGRLDQAGDELRLKDGGGTQTILKVNAASSSHTLTLPALTGADVLVSRTSTDTLTNKTFTSPVISGLKLDDTNSSNYLTLQSTSTLTGDRTLTLDVDDGARTLRLGGNLSVINGSLIAENTGVAGTLTLNWDADSTVTLPASGTLLAADSTATLTNKTFDADGTGNSLTNIDNGNIKAAAGIEYSKLTLTGSVVNADVSASAAIALTKLAATTASRALVSDGDGKISPSSVTATELGYVAGVSSAIQTQLNAKQGLDGTLTALAAFNSDGLLAQTAADTFTARSVAASNSAGTALSVSNGNGVSGNPTLNFNPANITIAQIGAAPLTTKGDLLTYDTAAARLGVGTDGQVLTADSGEATGLSWTSPLVNPMNAAGDIIFSADGSGTADNLALGTKGQRLRAGSTAPEYGWHSIKSIGTGDWPYTITDTDGFDSFYGTTGGTNRVLTMAVGANNVGRRITIQKTDSAVGKITITRQGSDNFGLGSASTLELIAQGDRVTLEGDSGRWRVIEFSRKPIVARYRLSGSTANTGLASGVREVIDFDTLEHDSHSSVTTGTTWKFTAKRAMVVTVSANFRLVAAADWSAAGESWRIEIRQNGTVKTNVYHETMNTASGSRIVSATTSSSLSLAAGDEIDITGMQSSGGAIAFSTGADDCTVSISEIPDLVL
jgi:hypothetical protein